MTDTSLPSEQPAPESGGTWGDTANLILGFWLFCAPPLLDVPMASREAWISVGLGLLLAGMAGAALVTARAWKEGGIVVIGLALIAAPWAFGFSSDGTAVWNSVICGLLVTAFAGFRLYDIFDEGHHGHDHGMPAT